MTKMTHSRLTRALPETVDDMRSVGVLDMATNETITLRHLAPAAAERLPARKSVRSVSARI